jgi:hypothetical protein
MVHTDQPRFRLVNPISLGSCGARKARMQGGALENSSVDVPYSTKERWANKMLTNFVQLCRYVALKYLFYATRQNKVIITRK